MAQPESSQQFPVRKDGLPVVTPAYLAAKDVELIASWAQGLEDSANAHREAYETGLGLLLDTPGSDEHRIYPSQVQRSHITEPIEIDGVRYYVDGSITSFVEGKVTNANFTLKNVVQDKPSKNDPVIFGFAFNHLKPGRDKHDFFIGNLNADLFPMQGHVTNMKRSARTILGIMAGNLNSDGTPKTAPPTAPATRAR
jgi:hypothetical protein